jgi:hypothetical protein
MATKLFTTYQPTEDHSIQLQDHTGEVQSFKLNPALPGKVILDFMFISGTEDSSKLASAISTVLDKAIVDEDKERWNEFINEPKNGVTVNVLSEVVGHVTSVLSGNSRVQE